MSTMLVACVLAVFIGNKLDELLCTSPWILLILLAYAIGSSIYLMVKKLGDNLDKE